MVRKRLSKWLGNKADDEILFRGVLGFFLHGIFLSVANAFTQITTVQTSFIYLLTGSNFLSGLLFTAYRVGTILPQPFAGWFVQRYPRKKMFVQLAIATRAMSWLIIAILTFWLGTSHPAATVTIFLLLLMIFFVMGGVGNVSYYHLFSQLIPAGLRGRLMGWRYFVGGILGTAAGVVTSRVLHGEIAFPTNYALLFLLAALALGVAFAGFTIIRDPGSQPVRRRMHWRSYFHLVTGNSYFLRLVTTEFFLSAIFLALPFYVIYARKSLGLPEATLGLFVMLQVVGEIISGPIWGWMGDRFRFRPVIIAIALVSTATPLMAILLPLWHPMLFALVFFLIGATMRGMNIATANYLLEFAPREEVAIYVGLKNFVMLPTVLFPLIGGAIVSGIGYRNLFWVEVAVLGIATLLSFGLKPTHPQET